MQEGSAICKIWIPAFRNTENYEEALKLLGADVTVCDHALDPGSFDGLLLPGGGDLDPALYGQETRGSNAPDSELDRLQLDALAAFVRAKKPVFGICRGLQVINVFFGGTLFQDLPQGYHQQIGRDQAHETIAAPGSFLAALYGRRFSVNSAHHQAIDALGEGLQAVQRTADGVIEAICHAQLPIWAVQWHPERMCLRHYRADCVDGEKLLSWFLAQ